MIKDVRILKSLADENRLRLLLLLKRKELFVCQLMAVTGLSQSLVSRSLSLLEREGFLDSRRQGKRVFYRLAGSLQPLVRAVIDHAAAAGGNGVFERDRMSLDLFCRRFRRGGVCDMEMVREFVEFRRNQINQGVTHGKTGQKGVH